MQVPEPSPGSTEYHVTTKRPSASALNGGPIWSIVVVVLTMKSLPAALPLAL